jgi:hypothetical protein
MVISKELKWFGLIFLLVILVIILFSTPDYQPYYKNIPYAKYEGFEAFSAENYESVGGNTAADSSTAEMESAVETEQAVATEPAPVEGMGNIFDSLTQFGNVSSLQGFATLHPAYTNDKGGVFSDGVRSIFTNQPVNKVVYGAKVGDSAHLDYFLDVSKTGVDGKDGCYSAGLSNSRGALCLTPDLIQQLKTRGGNASGL